MIFHHRLDCSTEIRAAYICEKLRNLSALEQVLYDMKITTDGQWIYIDGTLYSYDYPYVQGYIDGIKRTILLYLGEKT